MQVLYNISIMFSSKNIIFGEIIMIITQIHGKNIFIRTHIQRKCDYIISINQKRHLQPWGPMNPIFPNMYNQPFSCK